MVKFEQAVRLEKWAKYEAREEFIELTANLEKLSYYVSSDGSEVTPLNNQIWPLEEFLRVLIALTREPVNKSKHEFLEGILTILPMSETQIKSDQTKRVKKWN